jgi:hypothetical protein
MSRDLHVLARAVLDLDPAERLAPGWEAAWTRELARRSTAADGRVVRGAPWVDVRARLLRDLSSR